MLNMQDTPKKILLVITKSNWGGAQRYVFDVATSLPADQFGVTVALGGEGPLKQKLLDKGIRVISIPGLQRDVRMGSDISVFFFLLRLFRKERYDVVHLNSSKIGVLGALAGRLAGVKSVIFAIHGWAFNDDSVSVPKIITKTLYWMTLKLCHQAIAVSESVKIQAKGFGSVYSKIKVIHLGIAPMLFMDKNMARLAILKQADPKFKYQEVNVDDLWTGTIAELHPVKGQKYAIEAVAGVPSTNTHGQKFFIIGEGQERNALENLIIEKGLEKTAYLAGNMLDAAQYLPAFDIFLFSSLSEGLGYAILEAGLAGLPVIATNVGGIPEIITSMQNGILVEPKDSEALKNALRLYIDDTQKAKDFARELQKTVSEKFSLQKMIAETMELYGSPNSL